MFTLLTFYNMCLVYIVDHVQQFAFVTAIDEIGVDHSDMENVFFYKSVKNICKEVSRFLGIDIKFVHPVANYVEEPTPNAAKSTLSLMAFWHVIQCGKRYIELKSEPCFG